MPFFRPQSLLPTALAFVLAGAPALAQDEEEESESTESTDSEPAQEEQGVQEVQEEELEGPPPFPRLDLGIATGFNNPSGVYGFETHLRLTDHVGLGVMGGGGAWGFRLTPHARVYPLGVREHGFFVEGGLSVNFGGSEAISYNDQVIYEMTPTLTTALGYRFRLMNNRAWGLLRAGYGFRLKQQNVHTVSGDTISAGVQFWSTLRQHEGVLVGAALGMALF